MNRKFMGILLSFVLAVSLFAVLPAPRALAATTYTWIGGNSSWQTSTNWSPTRTTPAADDVLQFNGGGTVTVTSIPTQTIGQLLVSNNSTVNLQAATTGTTLTINGGTGTDLDVAAGSALNLTTPSNLTLSLSLGASATGSISGSMSCAGGTGVTTHTLLAATASSVTFNSGATFTQNTSCTGNVFGSTGTANVIVFASGSTFVSKAGSNPFGLTQPNSKVVFQSGSLYRHEQTGTPAFSGRIYANFELNIVGSVTTTGSAAVSIDDLTITSGTLNFNVTSTPGHSIKGNISVASGQTLSFSPSTAGTVNLNGTSTQTISGGGTISSGSSSTLVIGNSTGVIVSNDVTIGGTLTQAGNLTVSSGKTLTLGSNNVSYTSGTVTNNGTIQQTKSVSNATVMFGQFGTAHYGAEITTANNLGSTTVAVSGNQTCSSTAGSPLKRCWSITPTTPASASVKFYFTNAEMQTGQTLSSLNVWHYNGSTWDAITKGTTSGSCGSGAVDCYVEGTGISSYSPFALKNGNPLAAPLSSLDAVAAPGRVTVRWETASEADTLGFNLYRATAGGEWARLNATMIPSQAPGSPFGASYRYDDASAARGTSYLYRLAAVGMDGAETPLDSVSVTMPFGWLWLPMAR